MPELGENFEPAGSSECPLRMTDVDDTGREEIENAGIITTVRRVASNMWSSRPGRREGGAPSSRSRPPARYAGRMPHNALRAISWFQL
jgi:hypothetical protein